MMAATTRDDTGSSQVADGATSRTRPATSTAADARASPDHVEQGGAHVEVAARARSAGPGGDPVDHQSGGGHHHHDAGLDVLGVEQSVDAADTTISTVTAAISTALARAARMVARWLPNERAGLGRPEGQPYGHERQGQGPDVGQVVAGVGQQAGGVGDDAERHLGDDQPER